jgi:hypothetical protein
MTGYQYGLGGLLGPLQIKRKVFVSFHHANDQAYRDAFANAYSGTYDIFTDRSVAQAYDSENDEYLRWQIRQNDIKGSSCTVVLCGAQTPQRKHVDWEIKATLDFKHGLLGIVLDTCARNAQGAWLVPDRLDDTVKNGFGKWMLWSQLSPQNLQAAIEAAIACPPDRILNTREIRKRNR